jgi:hypothetical protein
MAERLYGDARHAVVIRAANKIGDGAQPATGMMLKIPGATVHTVTAGETLQKVADRFLAGEGGRDLLAETNALAPTAALKPGQVLTVFDELEVRTDGRSAEDLALALLGDANLGARLRRYNGVRDGAKLPSKTYVPLVGLALRTGKAPPTPTSMTTTKLAPLPKNAAPTVASDGATVAAPNVPSTASSTVTSSSASPPNSSASDVPVTSKLATVLGFTHELHSAMKVRGEPVNCLACHAHEDPHGFGVIPPRKSDCLLCHRQAEEMPSSIRRGQPRRLPLPMNHKLHVGENQIDCSVCHLHEPDRPLGIATLGHEACAACHTAGATPPYVQGDPQGSSCRGCHGEVEEVPVSAESQKFLRSHFLRSFGRVGDVSFSHLSHATFSPGGSPSGDGPALECRGCHADAAQTERKEEISRIGMQGCLECHRQSQALGLKPPQECAGCHLHHRGGLQPMNETVVKKPLDHTVFFRRNHAAAARDQAPMCASCHAGVDASDGTRCDTCHTTMRPRDHTAGFRDRVHGRLAQVDSTRCTTCHRAERCEACHREPPKSHFPMLVWVEKGLHGARGRLELGACLTCHRFEQTCARCHTATQK